MPLYRIRTNLETGEETESRVQTVNDLPRAARKLIADLLFDEQRRAFYLEMIRPGDDFPLGIAYVAEPRPLTEEETAWAQQVADEHLANPSPPASTTRYEER